MVLPYFVVLKCLQSDGMGEQKYPNLAMGPGDLLLLEFGISLDSVVRTARWASVTVLMLEFESPGYEGSTINAITGSQACLQVSPNRLLDNHARTIVVPTSVHSIMDP